MYKLIKNGSELVASFDSEQMANQAKESLLLSGSNDVYEVLLDVAYRVFVKYNGSAALIAEYQDDELATTHAHELEADKKIVIIERIECGFTQQIYKTQVSE